MPTTTPPFEIIEALDAAAAKSQKPIEKIVANAVRLLRAGTTVEQVAAALESISADPILTGEGWQLFVEALSEAFVPDGPLSKAMQEAVRRGAKEVPLRGQGINLRPLDQKIRDWIRREGAKKVVEISKSTERGIVDVVRRARLGPLPKAATRIAKVRGFGLTEFQSAQFTRWVDRFLARTQKSGSPLYDLSSKQIEQRIEREYRRRVRTRARVVAQTESYDAGNAARRLLWDEAEAQGKLDADVYILQWVTRVIGVCPRCLALAGKTAPIKGGIFVSEPVASGSYAGQILRVARPTVHPRCYCALRVVRQKDVRKLVGVSLDSGLRAEDPLYVEIGALAASAVLALAIPLGTL